MKLPIIATATLGIVVIIMQPIIEPLIPAAFCPYLFSSLKATTSPAALSSVAQSGAYMRREKHPRGGKEADL